MEEYSFVYNALYADIVFIMLVIVLSDDSYHKMPATSLHESCLRDGELSISDIFLRYE